MFEQKVDALNKSIGLFPSMMVAYSGGVDSACLLRVAQDVLGNNVLGVIADTPSLPRKELAQAIELARSFGATIEVVRTDEFENPDYLSNPVNRCYFCKHALFEKMEELAQERSFSALAYGENADDMSQIRPGRRAAEEFKILAPLRDAGLTKDDVRRLSLEYGLPTSTKPASPCLSSRIPHGTPVTLEALSQVESAEEAIRSLGFRVFRVRHLGSRAKLEFALDELPRAQESSMKQRIREFVYSSGYAEVEIDPAGYRSPAAVTV